MRTNKRISVLLFIIQPFLSLILAVKNYRFAHSRNIVWGFVAYFGLTFVISNSSIDANWQFSTLKSLHNSDLTLNGLISLLYDETSGYIDIVQPIIMFFVSKFTDNYRVLFTVYGLIFGYFYSRNIWYLIDRSGSHLNKYDAFLIITFALIIGFWNINGFRMYSAAHIFVFGALRYLIDKETKGLAIASASILFHFSFILPVALLLIFILLRNKVTLFFWFFIVSFFISNLDLKIVNETLTNILPQIFQSKIESYSQIDYAESRIEAINEMKWYAKYFGQALQWSVTGFLIIFYFKALAYLKSDASLYSLFGFTLLFMGTANIVSHIPSLGRFITVASLFAMALIFFFLEHGPSLILIKRYKYLAALGFLFFNIGSLRLGFDMIGVMAIIGNPIIALFYNIDLALIQLLK